MILLTKRGSVEIIDRGIPDFPADLEERYELAKLAPPKDTFFEWYSGRCALFGLDYPRQGTPEDHVHLRRLRGKVGDNLERLALLFLEREGDRLRGGYHHHLRLLSALLPELERERANRIG